MRIVHLNPFYFPYAGGIERRIRAVGRRQAALGHDVHVVTAQQPGTEAGEAEEDGMAVHRLPSTFPLRRVYNPPLVRTPGLTEALAALAPDVVDYHFRWSPAYNRAFRALDAPGVVTYHNLYGEGLGLLGLLSQANDAAYMHTLRRARAVVCVSEGLRRDLARRGVPEAVLRVSHNAVETDALRQVAGPPATAPAAPFAVGVGRMVAVKGFDVLVDAWARVPEPLDLVLVGEGPERARLQARARRRGVAHRIHFPGWVEEGEKVRLLKAAVAYLHPARSEAFGISVLEAMACGAPVVAAAVGGIPEVVGDAGALLGHEPEAWAAAVALLGEDAGERGRRADASRGRAARFDWDRIARELVGIYEDARRRSTTRW